MKALLLLMLMSFGAFAQVKTYGNFDISKQKQFKLTLSKTSVNRIGDIAEIENHHPDISFGWGYCKIKIFTHAIKGLAESDFVLAAKIDKIG